MSPDAIIAELQAVRDDYRGILVNIAQRRAVLDQLEMHCRECLQNISAVLPRIRAAVNDLADDQAGEWWKQGPATEDENP